MEEQAEEFFFTEKASVDLLLLETGQLGLVSGLFHITLSQVKSSGSYGGDEEQSINSHVINGLNLVFKAL